MRFSAYRTATALALAWRVLAVPFGETSSYGSLSMNRLFGRESHELFDPADLSFITKMAAVGDSYSAGIGAGERLGAAYEIVDPASDYDCSRYDEAYPYLVNTDGRLGDDPSKRRFQFKSCSGAVIKDVVEKQIPTLDYNQQVILVSAGGNDAELTNILNQCIFQWASLTNFQVVLVKAQAKVNEWGWAINYDFGPVARGCDGQLDYSEKIINSDAFRDSLENVVWAAKTKLASTGMVFWTGYAKFWGEDMDSACDKVSWSAWILRGSTSFQDKAYLTSGRRKRMNDLVDTVNSKIAAAVKQAGPSFEFVNYDHHLTGGRFCEPGVDEGSQENQNFREGLMFFEMNGLDLLGQNPWKRSEDPLAGGTVEESQNIFAQITLLADPEAKLAGEGQMSSTSFNETAADFTTQEIADNVPRLIPDGYGRVFHPQILLHRIISNMIIFHISNWNDRRHGFPEDPEVAEIDTSTCPYQPPTSAKGVLTYRHSAPGKEVKPGTELRILCVGDSITVGYLSDRNGGDGNGYRLQMRNDLSKDKVVYAGTVSAGTMKDGYFAGWSGKTIQYIADHVGPSLKQRPNVILVHAGTNDMNPNHDISSEGNDPAGAADRLGKLIDQMVEACPDAVILVAMIVNTCDQNQSGATKEYQKLVPGIVRARQDHGHHVLAVDFTSFPIESLQDCIHPTNDGYHLFGDYWYDFLTQIPKEWIKKPVGDGPDRTAGINSNGGLDSGIPPPDWGVSPVQPAGDKSDIYKSFVLAAVDGRKTCKITPHWYGTGKIALGGVGHNGDWHYNKDWVAAGEVASGLGRDPRYVRLHDMNGDGKADYIWLDPESGMIICWINNLPEPWAPAGNNDGIIGSGAGPADSVFLADMNGDGMDDYMVVNPDTGSVRIWWNYGPDPDWVNGWKFVDGGEIATGVPHANWATLRFPDINGDGRADYVYMGEGGALKHHLNTGSNGGQDVLFVAMGGIATGAASDISTLIFADMDGDGRDDYLIWDDIGGLTGFLNQPTNREGVPMYVNQGPPKTIADGITQNPDFIRLADLDGDGKDDYAYIDANGGIQLWWNRGKADTSMAIDGLRFADIDGDGADDYVWLHPDTGAPTVFVNKGLSKDDSLGWLWEPLNGGQPVASGAAPAALVKFGDIDGDGKDDYLVVDAKTGALDAYLNKGADPNFANGWRWEPIGQIATGLGPGANVRFADIDGDGKDDFIYLHPNGGATTIYANQFLSTTPLTDWRPLPEADASGIGQRPEEIEFVDINGDGKADYVWTSAVDGRVQVWFNDYPNLPAWRAQGEIAGGVGTAGSNIRWADLQGTGRASYIAVDPGTGAIAGWLNGCDEIGDANPRPDPKVECHAGSGCDDYKCPKGKEPRCPVLGGPATGYCQCFAKSSAQSRIFALLSGQNSTHSVNSTLSRGAWRNSTILLQDSMRNGSVIRHQKLS